LGMKSGEEKSFKAVFPQNSPRKDLAGKEGDFTVKVKSVQKMELPESGDEFAKQMGAFNTLVALKSSIKEGIMAEKQDAEKQKRREEILEKVSEKTKLDMPDAIVEYEKERLLEDFKKRVAQNVKISWEEYLASIKKTEKELAQAYQKEAEKRIRNFLVLREIGKKEGVLVDEKEVDEEVNKSIKNLSKQELDKVDIEQLKEYTKGVLYNEKVFNKLENN